MALKQRRSGGLSFAQIEREIRCYLLDVGTGIRAARILRGLTQAQLAAEAGVSARQLVALELGQNASLRLVARLCLTLKVSPEKLPSSLVAQTARAALEVAEALRTEREARQKEQDALRAARAPRGNKCRNKRGKKRRNKRGRA